MAGATLVTVAIPTLNGEAYLERLLSQVFSQRIDGDVEVLVIDSGSTDSTVDIVRGFPDVRLHEIPNHEFGHGRTRNLAAELGTGEFIVYLTQDAVPVDDQWLEQLVRPFALNERIVAVTGRQVARPTSFPAQKYEIEGAFSRLGPITGITIFEDNSSIAAEMNRGILTFHSDVNSAVRRDFITKVVPFRDVNFAEDQLLGQDIIEQGFSKAYAANAVVEHSNDLSLSEYGRRVFEETASLRRIGFDLPRVSRLRAMGYVVKGTIGDAMRITRDRDYGLGKTLYWLSLSPAYQVLKWSNYGKATRVDLDDELLVSRHSLDPLKRGKARGARTATHSSR